MASPQTGDSRSKLTLPSQSDILRPSDLPKYSSLVPFQFRVHQDFLSNKNNKDPTFKVNEIYSVHLVTRMPAVKLSCADGEFLVPLTSLATFGLIHEEQIECMTFEDVDELLFAKPCPKVVAVRADCTFPEFVLRKNEVLIVQDVIRAKVGKNRIAMKFFSIQQEKELVLYKEQSIPFTTSPFRTQLRLGDLFEHLGKELLPCQAKVFSDSNSTLPSLLTSPNVTLESVGESHSIIISHFRKNTSGNVGSNFIRMPASLPITLGIVQLDLTSPVYQEVVEQSLDLLRQYGPNRIIPCLNSHSDEAYSIQAQFLYDIDTKKQRKRMMQMASPILSSLLGIDVESGGKPVVRKPSIPRSQIESSVTSNSAVSATVPQAKAAALSPSASRKYSTHKKNRISWEGGDDSEDPYVVPPYFPKPPSTNNASGSSDSSKGSSDSTVVASTLPPPPLNATPSLTATSLQNSRSLYQSLVTAKASSSSLILDKATTRPIMPIPPKCSHSVDDYEEIEDYPIKDSKVPIPGHTGLSSLRFPLQEKRQQQTIKSSIPLPQEIIPTPYVKFLPTSPTVTELTSEAQLMFRSMAEEIKNLQKKVTELTAEVTEILQWKNQISYKLSNLKFTREKSGKTQYVISKEMCPDEVAGMLEAIGLPQYKEAFIREVVDGVTFLGLDDATLENELLVSSKIHRLRILKLKDGTS